MYDFSSINKYRRYLFGIATIWIAFFHSFDLDFSEISALNFLNIGYMLELIRRLGNSGVDIFLLLSGVGLYYSYSKDSNLKQFYKKRFLRVVPCSFIIVLIVTIFLHIKSVPLFLARVTFLHFFLVKSEDQTFWYVSAILFLYLLFPLFYRIINKTKIIGVVLITLVAVIISVIVYYVDFDLFNNQWEMLLTRIPVFLFGILIAPLIKKEYKISRIIALVICLVGTIYIVLMHIVFFIMPQNLIFTRHYFYCPLAMFFVFLFSIIRSKIDFKVLTAPIEFVGTYSLEMYLIHQSLYCLIPEDLSFPKNHPLLYALAIMAIALILSIMLKFIIDSVLKLFKPNTGTQQN